MGTLWLFALACGAGPTRAPAPGACGDGVVDPGEACDLGSGNDDGGRCTAACDEARCGDGLRAAWEGCDDGNAVDGDDCSNGCALPTCGDGILQVGEGCDDGNAVDDDACTNVCAQPVCGDGILQAGEMCDDANADDSDDCPGSCEPATCGDGVVHADVEECDAPEDAAFDTCFPDCRSRGMLLGGCDETGFVEVEDGTAFDLWHGFQAGGCCHVYMCLEERGLVRDPALHFDYRIVDDLGIDWGASGPGAYVRPDGNGGWQPDRETWYELTGDVDNTGLQFIMSLPGPEAVVGRVLTVTATLTEDDGEVFEDTRQITIGTVHNLY
jgi:cysteine-rich repeat protein